MFRFGETGRSRVPLMPISEFSLIDRYFAARTPRRPDVVLGIGDDCALLRPPPDQELAITLDTLVADVHFFAGNNGGQTTIFNSIA